MIPRPPLPARRALPLAASLLALTAAPPAIAQQAPAAETPAETIDLGALGVQEDDQGGRTNERPVQIYGFADFTYMLPLFPETSFLASAVPENQQFVMGRFNVYLAKQISERTRALGEIRFLYLPNGQITSSGFTSTSVDDPADIYRPISWGGVLIERLHVEHDVLPWLTIRGGQFLTPYGIWNVDHGSPTLIGIRRPYVIGEGLFPERQTGLEAVGRHFFSEVGVEYHLTLSNGRGPLAETRDLDSNKAIGGRVVLQWKRNFDLRVGFSYFRGQYTNRTPRSFDATTGQSTTTIMERFTEQSAAGDVSFDMKGLVFRGEAIASERRYDDRYRGTGPTFIPDNRRWGGYGLVGYRLPHGLLPFVLAEYYKFPQAPGYDILDAVVAYQAGLNYQLTPGLILKLEYTYAGLPGSPVPMIVDTPFKSIETQVAWVF